MTKNDIKKIIIDHKEVLQKYKVKSIALFGSYVRGEQREDSDVDFLVEFDEATYDNFINLVFTLEELLKKEVSVIPDGSLSPYMEPHVKKEAEKIEVE